MTPQQVFRFLSIPATISICLLGFSAAPLSCEGSSSETDTLHARLRDYVDGENIVLGVVDGEPITSEQIKAELSSDSGSDLDARVNVILEQLRALRGNQFWLPREQLELYEIYRYARQKALEIILLREAVAAGLSISDVVIDTQIAKMKERVDVEADNPAAWATYTLQQFNKTPLVFREDMRNISLREQVMALMAGEHGPIRQLQLPVFFQLDITPEEVRQEYERTKDSWQVIKDIEYTRIAIRFPRTTARKSRINIYDALETARERFSNESLNSVREYLENQVKSYEAFGVELIIEPNVKVENDGELEGGEARLVRSLRPASELRKGEISRVQTTTERVLIEGREEVRDVGFILQLISRTVDVKREFTDPVVQRQARDNLFQGKRMLNRTRVEEALIKRAIIVPESLLVRQ